MPFSKRSIHSKYYTNQILWNVYKFGFLFTPSNPIQCIIFNSNHSMSTEFWLLWNVFSLFPAHLFVALMAPLIYSRTTTLSCIDNLYCCIRWICDCSFPHRSRCSIHCSAKISLTIWIGYWLLVWYRYKSLGPSISLHHILHSTKVPLDLLHNSITSKSMTYSCCLPCMRETIWINNQCACQTSLTQYTNLIQLCISRHWASTAQFVRNILLRS